MIIIFQDVRQHGKDYSIIPEFRISEHVETYQSKGLTEEISNLFSLNGAPTDTADSSKDNFYKIYSTSEFMKHFEVVKKTIKNLFRQILLNLNVKAIKKLSSHTKVFIRFKELLIWPSSL